MLALDFLFNKKNTQKHRVLENRVGKRFDERLGIKAVAFLVQHKNAILKCLTLLDEVLKELTTQEIEFLIKESQVKKEPEV